MIQIIGVFPQVDHKKRIEFALICKRIAIMGFLDAQLAALYGEPHPATGEMSGSALGKLFLQTVGRPKGILDHALQFVRSAGFFGCQRMPVETVVPALSRVVE